MLKINFEAISNTVFEFQLSKVFQKDKLVVHEQKCLCKDNNTITSTQIIIINKK